jgi:hypothetical protein
MDGGRLFRREYVVGDSEASFEFGVEGSEWTDKRERERAVAMVGISSSESREIKRA